ncbi:MAG: GFA family protein [Deltaproteobacteria bacterium]|nr:GFA family protein [Deltaproteobacteria bacterium]
MKYQGSCHCGKIAYEVEAQIESLLECNCSLCSRRGYLLFFVPKEQIQLTTPASDMSTYTFNKHVIKHHFCPTCGCAPLGFGSDSKGKEMAAVNARCIPDLNLNQFKINHYDGKAV